MLPKMGSRWFKDAAWRARESPAVENRDLLEWVMERLLALSSLNHHPQMLRCALPQDIRDVDEFVSSSDLEKYSIASVSQQWMLWSEWVPSEWESDKNITIIHSPSVNIWRRQKMKQSIMRCFQPLLYTKYMSSFYNNTSSGEKVFKHRLQAKINHVF